MNRLAVLPIQDAKNLQDQLKELGVEITLDHNEQTCTRGCSVTVEILGAEKDIPIISKVFNENFKKLAADMNVNWDQINSVYDPNEEQATCPACGFNFSTNKKECPDCGLHFG